MFMVTEERSFVAEHRVLMADGSWEPYHAHEWLLQVSVEAETLDQAGFVVDFLALQELFDACLKPWEGQRLNEVSPFVDALIPTAECVAWQLYLMMAPQIDDGRVRLCRVALREAPTSWGIYIPTR